MKRIILVFSAILLLQSCRTTTTNDSRELLLWYDEPASAWTEALPLGNGRLGAMVFGGVETERIQLNEESLWTGGPIERANPEARENLDRVRRLLFRGRYEEAERLAQQKIMGYRLEGGIHTYQTLGDLHIRFDNTGTVSGYKRSLDLRQAIASLGYESERVIYKREVFASAPDNLILLRLSASEQGRISFSAWMNRPGDAETVSVIGNRMEMTGFAHHEGKGTRFASVVQLRNNGGAVIQTDSSLVVKDADEVVILISGRTNYWGGNAKEIADGDISRAGDSDFHSLKANHIADYRALFGRVELALNAPDTLNLPTDKRIERIQSGKTDTHLTELYFQFGRYLLISSSRPGGLPSNLQGIWDPTLSPPWNADYHININIQMNYWPALVTNLAECQEPFFDFVDGLRERGAITAREVYGCRGFVAHHTTDAWRFTDPIGRTGYGMWPQGAAWCSDHFWEHYDYTGDKDFLEKRAYPVLKEAALFFVDFLTEDPRIGRLVSGPSISPENRFMTPGKRSTSVCMGPAMDQEIIGELFRNCIRSAEILGIDTAFADTLGRMLERLAPPKIGSDGRIMEWSEPFAEADSGHRHMSHLYGLHPDEMFAQPGDTVWKAAARKSIETRLAHGGGHTGWSRAWIINFLARLEDGDEAHENLMALYARSTHPNLFDNHPPFQIDGNFGATAGIAEMLMQSHSGVIQVLPALPSGWKSGHITGLRARGGFEVYIEWEHAALKELRVKSLLGNPCRIKYGETIIEPEITPGETARFDSGLNRKK
ncbi:MAG: glycoside hydrolase N-terminal domain-containing protein [Bacteroidales bacterium]|nr:glycoside hydrolase N-terminal domain-containing protein [Bacteroidales bacterium]